MLTPREAGQINVIGPKGNAEAETLLCAHCQKLMVTRANSPGMKPYIGEMCRKCMKRICPLCMNTDCTPFMKKIEIYERSQALFRALGLTGL